jgi:hypothetical protein
MRLHLRRPWLAGLVVGLPIAAVAVVVVALLPSLSDLGPGVGPATAIGIVVASIVMAELAAHRHVRPWLAVVAWIGVAHATATVIVGGLAIAETEASTLAAMFGVLFGLVLLLLTMAVPWVIGGIAWLYAVRRVSGGDRAPVETSARAPVVAPGALDQEGGSTPADASTAEATTPGS